jgi:hypothetical protein
MAIAGFADDLACDQVAQRVAPEEFALLRGWLDDLRAEDPVSAREAAGRLDFLLDSLNVSAVGRWMLAGLRLHAGDVDGMRRYFRLREDRSVQIMRVEAGERALAQAIPPLDFLMTALGGGRCRVQAQGAAPLNAPPARPVLTPDALLVPDSYTALDAEDRFLLYRAIVAHALAHLRYSEPRRTAAGLKPMSVAVMSLIEDARVEQLLVRDYPGLRKVFLFFLRRGMGAPALTYASLAARLSRALADPDYQDDNYWVNKGRALFQEASGDLHDYARFREAGSILANDLGQMRVRFNPAQHYVHFPYRDDNSFLWDFGDAQDAAQQEPPMAIDSPVSVGASDGARNEQEDAQLVTVNALSYPEWDHRVELLKQDWCTLVEKAGAWPAAPGADLAPRRARHGTLLLSPRRLCRTRRIRRQWEGEDIDLNAAIDAYVDRRLRLSPEPRIFLRPGQEDTSASLLILMDLSASTNDRLPEGGETMLDLEKQAALVLADAVSDSSTRLAIHGFSSNTRHEINYFRMLDFPDRLDERRLAAIRNVRADYSTRMGSAIRHATACLGGESASQRFIVVMTDGAPSDIDVYDPEYLIQDARVAVQDARGQGVRTFCLTTDPQAAKYVRTIFGARNYQILDNPYQLCARLSRVFTWLAAS